MNEKDLHKKLREFLFDKDYDSAVKFVNGLSFADYHKLYNLVSSYALSTNNMLDLMEDAKPSN